MKNFVIVIIAVLIIAGVWLGYRVSTVENKGGNTDKIQPSPIVTITPAETNPTHDKIVLDSPVQEQTISSPLTISGKARGPWYFEGSFPVLITDWDGIIIAEGIATAHGEWMTEDFVPYTAELVFTKPPMGERGNLILKKDNPSGLPENDDAYEIVVRFE